MCRFQHSLIVILGIIISFSLFAECEKLNPERKFLDETGWRCQLYKYSKRECDFYFDESIRRKYGMSYINLKELKNRRTIYYSLPMVGLILTMFVVFAANRNEIFLSFLAIQPLVFFLSGSDEAFLIPLFLIFIPAFAFLLRRLKQFAFRRLAAVV